MNFSLLCFLSFSKCSSLSLSTKEYMIPSGMVFLYIEMDSLFIFRVRLMSEIIFFVFSLMLSFFIFFSRSEFRSGTDSFIATWI